MMVEKGLQLPGSSLFNYREKDNSERSEAFRPSLARVFGQLGNRSVQKKHIQPTTNHQPPTTNQQKIHDLRSCFPQNFETNQNFLKGFPF